MCRKSGAQLTPMRRPMQEQAAPVNVVRFFRKILTPIWLALATIAALAPFLNKAFHIDDPLFLWMAEQITPHRSTIWLTVNWSDLSRENESPDGSLCYHARSPGAGPDFTAACVGRCFWSSITCRPENITWPGFADYFVPFSEPRVR